jgi:Major capsid protein N-terminus/Large eukaryotic DNA virus major capsid protein
MSNSGGLLQLVATGRQDIYLSGNPQTTFFKQVYRRYTNFSVETQRIPFDTAVDFGKLVTVKVPRTGDLLSQLYLQIDLPEMTLAGPVLQPQGIATETPINYAQTTDSVSWVNSVGYAMIDYISVWIGQQEIDRQYGEFMYLWTQLTTPGSKRNGVNYMTGTQDVYTASSQQGPLNLIIPLSFWFCKNPGLALPLIALQATPIQIWVRLKDGNSMLFTNGLENAVLNGTPAPTTLTAAPPIITDMILWGDFIYLDTEERRRFVSSRHEYLIEQVQQQKRYSIPLNTTRISVPLVFNNPIKEFIWVVNEDRMLQAHEWFNYGSRMLNETGIPNLDIIATAQLQFDGYDRFEVQNAPYFRLMQPWQRHTAIPNDFIYVYSFSLAPEAEQPMGTCNGSRLDSIVLQLSMNPRVQSYPSGVTTYATNYNILRIVAGLGGVLFTV